MQVCLKAIHISQIRVAIKLSEFHKCVSGFPQNDSEMIN